MAGGPLPGAAWLLTAPLPDPALFVDAEEPPLPPLGVSGLGPEK